ncbi:MAG TPA: alcohol dehydrogenase catalytic domain-containing protein [Candidatus Limnocylindrales bacterium]|nr:alcohol dehydrogenase catalytic domain-containing protein [Candidatus Limnocylindrales bacterium]
MDRQVRFVAPHRVNVVETSGLQPSENQVRVRVKRCGICGSDLHVFRRNGEVPTVCPGHEMSGIVDAVGPGAGGAIREGDAVVVEPLQRCGQCARCRSGDYHLCSRLELFGVSQPGGMATHVLVPSYTLFALPSSLDFELGAMAEPTAVSVHAARLGGVRAGSRVLVLGAGTIGLLALAAARHLGAEFVAITARHPHQRRIAEMLGADQVLAPDELRSLSHKPDLAIETVGGAATTVADAVMAVQRGGTVVIVGLFDATPVFDPFVMLLKEVRLIGSMVYNRPPEGADFAVALDVLASRADALRALITHRFGIDDVQQAFETASDKRSGAIKVLLQP